VGGRYIFIDPARGAPTQALASPERSIDLACRCRLGGAVANATQELAFLKETRDSLLLSRPRGRVSRCQADRSGLGTVTALRCGTEGWIVDAVERRGLVARRKRITNGVYSGIGSRD